LDPSGTPASLSKAVVTHWMRDSLGYQGLSFTDALNMKGVAQDLAPGELEVRAFEAGHDVLLFCGESACRHHGVKGGGSKRAH
ncbi:MAG: hypothetical protein EBV77_11975, partial [Gemmatimonadaceae bacterium]|nr:hypothetical protein [Gemmatimonadaceae bacterium]